MQYDRSLLTEDIVGAQPKPRFMYLNRLIPNQLTQEEQKRLQKQIPHHAIKFGRKRYQNDLHHFCNICIPMGEEYLNKSNQKNNKITRDIIQLEDLKNNCDFHKMLQTKDIDGAVPGSLQSQAVRNQDIAKKLRQERQKQNNSWNNSQLENCNKEENYENQCRQKSHSIQFNQLKIMNANNQLTENNEISKFPPISERISATIDHIANRLQLRQQPKSLQCEDLNYLKKQAQMKFYV